MVDDVRKSMSKVFRELGYKDKDELTAEQRGREKEFEWHKIDFYDFSNLLPDIYEVILKERKSYEVLVNITGGTKFVGVAATLAAALANTAVFYFAAEEYVRDEESGRVRGRGVIRQPFHLEPLFELYSVVLNLSNEEYLLLEQLSRNQIERGTVADLLELAGIKPERSVVAKYSYYRKLLQERKLISFDDGIRPTKLGELVLRLTQISRKYDGSES